MAHIGLIRVDSRLIHGQVVTTWVGQTKSDRIIIVDDDLVKNEYLASVYEMAAPKGVPVEIKTVEQVAAEWLENELGAGTVLVLFKDIPALKEAYDKGFDFDSVQIAGLAGGPGRKLVVKAIGISQQDASMLKELNDKGVTVGFQSMPGEKFVTIQSVIGKFFKELA